MRTDIRKYLPASEDDVGRLEQALSEAQSEVPGDKRFDQLMDGVRAARRLQRYRCGDDAPQGLGALVDTVRQAYGLSDSDVLSVVRVGKSVWRKALAGRVEPYRIAATAYARLAARFELGFPVLKKALQGSYRTFVQQNLDMHVRFARASVRSRRTSEFPAQMTSAFKELRAKSAAHRQALAGNGAIDSFLAELEQCMS